MIPKRLITHGCSFTYGEELAQPSSAAWPALVAGKLGIDLVNLARPAYSNDAIIEDIVGFDLRPEDLVIICWTSYLRIKLVDKDGWFTTIPGLKFAINGSPRTNLIKTIQAEINTSWLYTRWLTQIILAQSHFNTGNNKWLFFNAFDNIKLKDKRYDYLTNKISTRNFIGWPDETTVEWTYGTPKGPRGHPLEQGHSIIADKILNNLKTIHDLPRNI